MKTMGIDLASQHTGTADCRILWAEKMARVEAVEEGVEDERLKELLADREIDWTGIDVPLGWPDVFVQALQAHRAGEAWPHTAPRELTHRATDRWLINNLRIYPLSVSTDRIAYPAMRAAALTAGMARDGSDRLVEVYPAAALNVWQLQYQRYKRSAGRSVLSDIISVLRQRAPWLVADERSWRALHASDHAFDALVAALIARAHARGLCHPIPAEDRDAAVREGWISVPNCALDQLVG
jgi:predicted nuclease with RNAse H fold